MSNPQKYSKNDVAGSSSPTLQPDITTSDIAPQPSTNSLPLPPSPRPTTAPSLKSPVQSESVEDLIAVSQEIFANPESPKKSTPTKCQLTPAQQQRIEMNRKEAIRRRNERFKQERSELGYKTKYPRATVNLSPNNRLHTFYKDGKCYNACFSCHKFFLCGQTPTPRVKIDCECRKTAICSSCGNYI